MVCKQLSVTWYIFVCFRWGLTQVSLGAIVCVLAYMHHLHAQLHQTSEQHKVHDTDSQVSMARGKSARNRLHNPQIQMLWMFHGHFTCLGEHVAHRGKTHLQVWQKRIPKEIRWHHTAPSSKCCSCCHPAQPALKIQSCLEGRLAGKVGAQNNLACRFPVAAHPFC